MEPQTDEQVTDDIVNEQNSENTRDELINDASQDVVSDSENKTDSEELPDDNQNAQQFDEQLDDIFGQEENQATNTDLPTQETNTMEWAQVSYVHNQQNLSFTNPDNPEQIYQEQSFSDYNDENNSYYQNEQVIENNQEELVEDDDPNKTLMQRFNDEEVMEILKLSNATRLETGEFLFKKGEAGDYMYILLSGDVEVIIGEDNSITISGNQTILGELAFFEQKERTASIKALTDISVIFISREDYKVLEDTQPKIVLKLLKELVKVLAARLRNVDEVLIEVTHKNS